MRSFFLLVACLASLNTAWAKDEFLLRNLIPAQHQLFASNPYSDNGPLMVLLYSTESKTWLPPLFWQSPANYLAVSLESTQPHFVRLYSTKQTVDLGYVDFHRLVTDQKQPPLLALYVAKQQRRVAKGETYSKQVTEAVTRGVPTPVQKTKPLTHEVTGTNPTTNKPANYSVDLPVQKTVTEMLPETKMFPVTVKETALADLVIDDEHIALGVQEFLAIDQESLEPAVERANKPAPAADQPSGQPPVQPAGQATFRLLQVTPPGTSFAIEPAPNVWLYSTKDKEWRNAVSMNTQGLSEPLPLNPGLHFLNLSTTTYDNNIGYVDFAAVSKEQKDPLFVLETLKERFQVRQGQEYLRSMPSFVENARTNTVMVPVTKTKPITYTDTNTGQTFTKEVSYTEMVPEQRTTTQRMAIIKTEKAKAARDETIEQEMPRLSLVREQEVDRKMKAPELAHPTPDPEAFRAKAPTIQLPVPAGRPSYAPPAPVPEQAPPTLPPPRRSTLRPVPPEGLPAQLLPVR